MGNLVVFDTRRKRKIEIKPLLNNQFRIYTCGPTVYNFPHIGNYRSFLFEDLLRRYLKYKGYGVYQIMNLTDVDDKTIRESNKNNMKLFEYTSVYIDAFFEDIDMLNMERAEKYPRATDHIKEMIEIIEVLIKKGFAYKSGDSVYFDISKFSDYGQLSGAGRLTGDTCSRIDHDEYEKDNVRDFVLWKGHKEGEPYWESPWGKGRPGWHIECSAMSMKYLGTYFDLHTGGVDNIFPHHENEIAQSVAYSGDKFVNYWMHAEFLLVDGEKMSKTKNNFWTIRDLLKKGHSPLAFRYLVFTTHYRKQLNFTFESLSASQNAINRLNDFIIRLKNIKDSSGQSHDIKESLDNMLAHFENAMDDDLNTSRAMGHVFDFVKYVNSLIDSNSVNKEDAGFILSGMEKINKIFDIMKIEDGHIESEILDLIEKRESARRIKDYKKADEIRDRLQKKGICLKDTKDGVVWHKT